MNQESGNEQKAGTLLDDEQRAVCEQLAGAEAPHGQRAQALLALDEGANQDGAADCSGMTKNQVKYWLGRFRKNGLGIFPEDLVDQARSEMVPSPAGVLLDDEQRIVCERLASGEEPHGQRAQALLALDEGATQAAAADRAGLSKNQVKYWLGRFRKNGLGIFPEDLVDQARPETAEPESVPAEEEAESAAVDVGEPVKAKKKKSKKGKGKSKKAKKSKKSKKDKKSKKKSKKKKQSKKSKKAKGKSGKKSKKKKKK
jgi:transposase